MKVTFFLFSTRLGLTIDFKRMKAAAKVVYAAFDRVEYMQLFRHWAMTRLLIVMIVASGKVSTKIYP